MVRKKKTSGSTTKSNIVEPPTVASSSSPHIPSGCSSFISSLTATDVLCVGLSKSKVSTGTSNTKGGGVAGLRRYIPRVILSEQDATRLDILADEDVIVLGRSCTNNASSISGALICKALVSKQQNSSSSALRSSPSSYSSPSSKKSNASAVTVGSIQIQPSDMLNLLLPHHTKSDDESKPAVISNRPFLEKTPVTPTPKLQLQTPPGSSNKSSSFSFQIGGGGDALYNNTSPLSIRKPPHTKTPSSSSSSSMHSNDCFWILPMESRFGLHVVQQITTNNNNNGPPCYCRIHLEPLISKTNMDQHENNTDSSSFQITTISVIPSNSTKILERIILATYIGRFVQEREILCITFQGKVLQLQIIRVEIIDTTTTSKTASHADDDDDNDRDKKKNTSDHDQQTITEKLEQLVLVDDNDNNNCNSSNYGNHNNTHFHESSLPSLSEEAKQLLQQVSHFQSTTRKRLCKVTYETQISVSVSSTNKSRDDDASTSTIPKHLQQQQRVAVVVPQQHVVGLSFILKQVRDLLWMPLTRPDLFVSKVGSTTTASIKPPRGILLHGPSGVGKSCLARQIAAEFSESNICEVQFINCILLQSQSAIVGQAERQLSKYFQPSGKQMGRPKLLIFDDIHLICPRRGGGGFTDQLASTLLALLDGIEASSSSTTSSQGHNKEAAAAKIAVTTPIVILAVTSNPSLLDPALRRPGRLDVEVEVPIPDEPSTRAEILKFHVMQNTTGPLLTLSPDLTDENWLMLAKLAKGFTGADCMLAVKEAMRTTLFRRLRLSAAQQSILPKSDKHDTDIELTIHDLAFAIRATKPSSIKSITVEIPRVPWTSIGGMDEVKRELREAIELPLTHGDLFQRLGVPPPRGILLYGPPGCSKTLMARALATEGQMNFLSVKGPELLSKWLGESERALASLFRRARMASPSIIFFDEIDAIASARGSGDSAGSGGRLLSQLLTELDGVVYTNSSSAKGSKNNRVVVVGATNRPDLLDRALTRPGRIDRMIYVGVPDTDSRRQIFKVALKDKSCDNDIDLEYLSRDEVSMGFSGAEIVAICQDAALFALEETDDSSPEDDGDKGSTPKVSMRHLLKATKGMQRQITPEMLDFYASYQSNTNADI